MSATAAAQNPIRSTIPARLDRLGWSPFHNAEGKSLEDVTKPLSAADQTSTVRPAPTTIAAGA